MKAHREHEVPLSDHALDVPHAAQALRDDSGLPFPSPRGQPLSDMTLSKLIKETRHQGCPPRLPIQLPGLGGRRDRPSARSVVEAALTHQVKDKVEAAYARETLCEHRRRPMNDWSSYLGRRANREPPFLSGSGPPTPDASSSRCVGSSSGSFVDTLMPLATGQIGGDIHQRLGEHTYALPHQIPIPLLQQLSTDAGRPILGSAIHHRPSVCLLLAEELTERCTMTARCQVATAYRDFHRVRCADRPAGFRRGGAMGTWHDAASARGRLQHTLPSSP